MPDFFYRGRDKNGQLRTGERFANTADNLSAELINEGISPFEIKQVLVVSSFWQRLLTWFNDTNLHREELAIFARQMELLHKAGVPMVTALKQLGEHTRSKPLAHALVGVIAHVEKGESLGNAMQQYPSAFSPLIINIIRIGESTGHLSEAFSHIQQYLDFEVNNQKQIKSAFRYPMFIFFSIISAVLILNLFVIPSFAKFYQNMSVSLPWETLLLIYTSSFFVHYGIYVFIALLITAAFGFRYLRTEEGQYHWHRFQLRLPVLGKLIQRIILIRFSQSLSIMLNSGLSITQGLALIKQIVTNTYISKQVDHMINEIERGVPFSATLSKVSLFTPLEVQILAVGEKNGELSPALNYIAGFHSHEITFDLKRMNDLIGPILISAVSGIILIMALGIYLPIWNMINLVH